MLMPLDEQSTLDDLVICLDNENLSATLKINFKTELGIFDAATVEGEGQNPLGFWISGFIRH